MTFFDKPERKNSKLRIAIQGLSFTGKTYSALSIARGLVGETGRIALVDCEGGESELYAEEFDFESMVMLPPYTPEKFIEAIQAAKDEGFDVVILDTISNEWAGQGGLLDDHGELEKAMKNKMSSFSAWGEITPRHNKFVGAMINSDIHVIATIRSKNSYVIDNVNGINKPRKVSLGPIQRENISYEFSIYLEIDESHTATVIKDRTHVIGDYGTLFEPTIETGEMLRNWLNGDDTPKTATVIKPGEELKKENVFSEQRIKSIKDEYIERGWNLSVFDVARRDDGLYNFDKIDEDYQQRLSIQKKKAEQVNYPKTLDNSTEPSSYSKTSNNSKDEGQDEGPEQKQKYVCAQCGAEIDKVQYDVSQMFLQRHLCKHCMNEKRGGARVRA